VEFHAAESEHGSSDCCGNTANQYFLFHGTTLLLVCFPRKARDDAHHESVGLKRP
jgi:hypothetical protein